MISLVATVGALVAPNVAPPIVARNVEGGGPVCRVYMGTYVRTRVEVVPCASLFPIISSSRNFLFSSLDSRHDVTKSATLVSGGNDD